MRRIALLAAMGVLAIAACSPQTASTLDATATDTPASPAATSQPTPSATGAPTPEITREQVVLPQPDDWVRGPDTAAVTFIEWGDFQ